MMCLYKQPEEWMLPAGISSLQPQVKNGNSAAQCSKMWIDLPHQAHPTPVRPFLPTIHCVILPGSHWLQIKVLNLTSLYLQPYTASSSNFIWHLTHNSVHISTYLSLPVWEVIHIFFLFNSNSAEVCSSHLCPRLSSRSYIIVAMRKKRRPTAAGK